MNARRIDWVGIIVLSQVLMGCLADPRRAAPIVDRGGFLASISPSMMSSRRDSVGDDIITGSAAVADRRVSHTDLGKSAISGATAADFGRLKISDDGKQVEINFVDVDIQEFVRVVFDEVLHQPVIVDPAISGKVTIRTARPVSKTAALQLVGSALQIHGASLTQSGEIFRVSRAAKRGGRAPRIGENIRVVPLKFLSADEAREVLQPFTKYGAEVIANKGGGFLLISAQPSELDELEQLLTALDVDQLQGMSFALMPLQEAAAQAIASELTTMFGSDSGSAIKALPIQRMNAVLVIARGTSALSRAKDWIQRLDQGGHDGRRIFVYPVQNRRARDLIPVLSGMLGARNSDVTGSLPVAPGLRSAVASRTAEAVVRTRPTTAFNSSNVAGALPGGSSVNSSGSTESPTTDGPLVSADLATNSIVTVATPDDYRIVEAAIRRLDVLPTQVIIEATIAEVELNSSLRHGVRWFFESGKHGIALDGAADSVLPGFSYKFQFPSAQVPKARVVLNMLEAVTDVEVISSPALTVLDNQTATLKVGDQVPIATRSARSTTDPDAPIVNDIEMKDPGIILSVTPRVNASGIVQLDITQEASDVVPTTTSSIDSPTIRQRSVSSSVAVHSGTEIVLGGLISTRQERTKSGIPFLMDIPVVGAAFTSDAVGDAKRTELLIIIRPIVIRGRQDVVAITREIKAQLKGLRGRFRH